MPYAAKHPCTYPGCPALVDAGQSRCDQHRAAQRRQSDAHRGSARERGYTAEWDRRSKAYLLEHPWCVRCEGEGRTMLAQCVDHRIPHRGDPVLFWDESNWDGLCIPCHNHKTATEDGGFGHKASRGMGAE